MFCSAVQARQGRTKKGDKKCLPGWLQDEKGPFRSSVRDKNGLLFGVVYDWMSSVQFFPLPATPSFF
jgi:hypothetical protein